MAEEPKQILNQRVALSQLHQAQFAPKYVELAQTLLRQIARENLKPGDRLGTEAELGRQHGLSRITVRQALAMLEREGYVSREKARGTFVKARVDSQQQLALTRGIVAVVCSNEQASHADDDVAFATILRAMERTLARQGFTVQIVGIGEDEAVDRVRLGRLVERSEIQGLCTIGPCLEHFRELLGGVPVVTSCAPYASAPPLVRQDLREVGFHSIRYLLSCGHSEIGLLCGSWMDQRGFAMLAEGYRQAFAEAGLRCPRRLLHHAYPGESLEDLARDLLSDARRPTAILAENWQVCRVVLAIASQLGLQIPADLSIIGYGQNVLHIVSPVAITAFVPDSEQIGQMVANIMTDVVDGRTVPRDPIAVPGRLIERDSVRRLRPAQSERKS